MKSGAGRKECGGEDWIEEAWKTDATGLVHFVLTLSARMSVYVAARSYISLPYTRVRVYVRVYTYTHERTAGPPATVHLRVHVHTYVCTTSTGTLPGIIDPRYHTDSIPARMLSRTRAYSRL